MPKERRYSDQEVSALLARAADLSVEQNKGGLSLTEVERIAQEAGLDAALVRQAAAELARGAAPTRAGTTTTWQKLFGKVRLRFETVVPGEMDEAAHEDLFDAVQEHLGLPGTLNRAGRAFSWTLTPGANGGRSLTIHVSPKGGQTVVRVEERLGNLAGGLYGGLFGGAGGGLSPMAGLGGAALFGPVGAVLGVAATLALTLAGTRALYGKLAGNREEDLARLFEALTDIVAEHAVTDESALAAAKERQGLLPAAAAEEPVPVAQTVDAALTREG